jgi:hypothetical protein
MGGNTGNIRSRTPSSVNGYKTFMSILASDSGAGAGSVRRMYGYYASINNTPGEMYNKVFKINYGQFRSRSQWFLSSYNQ